MVPNKYLPKGCLAKKYKVLWKYHFALHVIENRSVLEGEKAQLNTARVTHTKKVSIK